MGKRSRAGDSDSDYSPELDTTAVRAKRPRFKNAAALSQAEPAAAPPAVKQPKQPRAKKARKPPPPKQEPLRVESPAGLETLAATGRRWRSQAPNLIFLDDEQAEGSSRIVAFDLDGTLVLPKQAGAYARDADDWRWLNSEVPEVLSDLAQSGCKILVFSNQGNIKSALGGARAKLVTSRVSNILAVLEEKHGVRAQVLLATQADSFRMPGTGMWNVFVQNMNGGVEPDLSSCLYVASEHEAAGRQFAANVGIPFLSALEVFGEQATDAEGMETAEGGNKALARAFQQLADMQRAAGDYFRCTANGKVAAIIAAWPEPILSSKQLKNTQGVGNSSLKKIEKFLATGQLVD